MNPREEHELEETQEAIMANKRDWRTNLVVLTAVLNVIALLVFIFGGMNWITQVNTRLETTARQIEITATAVKDLQNWSVTIEKRHSAQDAIREYLETHPEYNLKTKKQ